MLWMQHKKIPKLLPGTDVLEFNWLRGFQRRHHTPNATCHRLVPTSPLLKPAGVMFHSGLLPFRRHQTTWRGAGRIFLLSASSLCWRAAIIQTDSAVRHWQGFYVPAEMSPLCYLRTLKDDRRVHVHSLTGSCVKMKVLARQTSFARPQGRGSYSYWWVRWATVSPAEARNARRRPGWKAGERWEAWKSALLQSYRCTLHRHVLL